MEAKDASDDDGDGFWPTRPKASKDDGRPSDLRLSPAEGDPASLDDILLSEGKDDDDEPSSPSRPSEVKDAKEIGNRQRTLSRTLSGAYRATRARVTRTSSDDGDKARRKVEALVGVLANAQATSTKLLKAASQLRVLAMDKDAKAAVVDAGAVPRLAVPNSNLQLDFNVSVRDSFDATSSAVLRELDESDRFVQKSAESTSM